MTMNTTHHSATQRSLGVLTTAMKVGTGALATAIIAGLALLVIRPTAGSSTEAALGIAAAIAGFGVAASAVFAAIYAQVRGLWELAPAWIRRTLWAYVVIGVVLTVLNQFTTLLEML